MELKFFFSGGIGSVGSNWHVAGIGDFNGDGRSDILWRGDDSTLGMWQMNGTQIQSAANFGTVGTDWHVVGIGDFNHDNRSDILWRSDNGTIGVWEMNGTQILTGASIGAVGTDWQTVTQHYDFV